MNFATDAPTPINYRALDPGIRETVRWLNAHGFATSDSGDGRAKLEPLPDGSPNPRGAFALPFPHVVIPCAPVDLVTTADRLAKALRGEGLGKLGTIEASYRPGERAGIVMLSGVDDAALAAARERAAAKQASRRLRGARAAEDAARRTGR